MQATELHDLITNKLEKNRAAHYNVDRDTLVAFSPPGETYWNVERQNYRHNQEGTIVEYHTPTHYYTLNDVGLNVTVDMHSQFKTIMRSNGITVASNETHEEVEINGKLWMYDVWAKPYTDCYNIWGAICTQSKNNDGLINTYAANTVKFLNTLAAQPMGMKVWPDTKFNYQSFYVNDDWEAYWQSPLSYTNRYVLGTGASVYAKYMCFWLPNHSLHGVDLFADHILLNPQLYSDRNLVNRYTDDLNTDVFEVN
jgi:hypothetical protein